LLFNKVDEEKIDSLLFAGMMCALKTFAEQISNKMIQSFEVSEERYIIFKRKNLLFIAKSSKNVKQKKIKRELEYIIEKFFELYDDDLIDFDGNISLFSLFEEYIDETCQDSVEMFAPSIWQLREN